MRNRSNLAGFLVAACCMLVLPMAAGAAGAPSQPSKQQARSPMLPPTPAEMRDVLNSIEGYDDKLEKALRASPSPRDQALSTQIPHFRGMLSPPSKGHDDAHGAAPAGKPGNEGFYMPSMGYDAVRGALLRKAAEAAPQDRLVQWIWANANNGASGCDPETACPQRGRALAALDPDNAAAWIPVVARAMEASDTRTMDGTKAVDGAKVVDEALSQMAAARHFDDMEGELADAWTEVMRRIPPDDAPQGKGSAPSEEPDPDLVANMTAAHASSVMFSLIHVVEACEGAGQCAADPRRPGWCVAVARKLASGSNSFAFRTMGLQLLSVSPLATREDRQDFRIGMWQYMQYMQLAQSAVNDPAMIQRLDLPSGNRVNFETMKAALVRAKISLAPPDGWSPPSYPQPASAGCATH